MRRVGIVCFMLVGGLVASARGAEEVLITSCGQVVARRQIGVLVADLNCPSSFVCAPACGPFPCAPYAPAVACRTTADCPAPDTDFCSLPPGGDFVAGVRVESGGRVDLNGHTISGAFHGIIARSSGPVTSRIKVTGPGTIAGCDEGLSADKVRVSDLTIDGNELGVVANRATVQDVTADGNDVALFIRESLRVKRASMVANHYAVLSYRSARVSESTLTGNGWDIATVLRPRVSPTTTCRLSTQLVTTNEPGIYAPGPPWGVCAND